jgi:hypothetical protein
VTDKLYCSSIIYWDVLLKKNLFNLVGYLKKLVLEIK